MERSNNICYYDEAYSKTDASDIGWCKNCKIQRCNKANKIHIYGVNKQCTQETIAYYEIDNTTVEKKYYDQNGKCKRVITKEVKNSQDFMLEMIERYRYQEI